MTIKFKTLCQTTLFSFFAFVCVFSGGLAEQCRAAEAIDGIVLRFDGIYQSEKQEDYYQYLRFYDDGTVIAVSSTGTPEQVAKWFTRKHDVSRGTYIITGRRIVFTATSESGAVDYDGRIKTEQMEFRTYSHINQHQGTEKFSFVKVEVGQE
jgi:hypothetical protein